MSIAVARVSLECVVGSKDTRPNRKNAAEPYLFVTLVGMGWKQQARVTPDVYGSCPPAETKVVATVGFVPISAKVDRGGVLMSADVCEMEIVGVKEREKPKPVQ